MEEIIKTKGPLYTLTQYKDQIANDLLHKNYFKGKLAFDLANIISGKPTERSYQLMSWVTSLKFIRFQTKYTFVSQHEYQFNSNFTDNFGFFLNFSSNIYLNKFAQTTQYNTWMNLWRLACTAWWICLFVIQTQFLYQRWQQRIGTLRSFCLSFCIRHWWSLYFYVNCKLMKTISGPKCVINCKSFNLITKLKAR